MKFKVGDKVEWTSQAAGIVRRKVGEVIEVVPPGVKPSNRVDCGLACRDHESYVVRAFALGRRSGERAAKYWPRVSALARGESPSPDATTEVES